MLVVSINDVKIVVVKFSVKIKASFPQVGHPPVNTLQNAWWRDASSTEQLEVIPLGDNAVMEVLRGPRKCQAS